MTTLLAFGALLFFSIRTWIISYRSRAVEIEIEASMGPKPSVFTSNENRITKETNNSFHKLIRLAIIFVTIVARVLTAFVIAALVIFIAHSIIELIKNVFSAKLISLLIVSAILILMVVALLRSSRKEAIPQDDYPRPMEAQSGFPPDYLRSWIESLLTRLAAAAIEPLLMRMAPREKNVLSSPVPVYKHLVGTATLLSRVYKGDSHPIVLQLKNMNQPLYLDSLHNSKTVEVRNINISLERFLEVELIAAGLQVDGEKKQRQPLQLPHLSFRWNCYFEKSGIYQPTLILRTINRDSEAIEIGIVQYNVRVATFFNLTQRQAEQLGWVCGGISGLFGLLWTLRQLGWM